MPAPKPDLRALGVQVARLRHDRDWSIDRLAAGSGVHRKTIIEVEAGRVAAKVSTLHAIAHALGVPLAELVAPLCARHPKQVGVQTELVERHPADDGDQPNGGSSPNRSASES
ncbi:helix-turn-helix transcriptional regulator [Propionibacterium freudenreichii]|uniref:helix-turn-helix domain-containing protein n=1 Tax=Propionibacterium freudenreichii TaxID=1744 RepID=UPI0024865770|nr:helix-turn-helix transcriptional regulator [Propionibacterium freudenreichii]MDK9638801.1 helix-turn-helix transcriptional regulator [Propionibacterium freudenreichii]WGU90892.1 helix-turn-helix transcriptional regulator [Propionibacterium freudenreichii]